MKSFRPLSMLLLAVAIGACTPPRRPPVAVAKPAAPSVPVKPAPAPPAVTTAPIQLAPAPRVLFDAARADIDAGQAEAALAKLAVLGPEHLDGNAQLQWHTLRASAYSLQGSLLDAVRERVAADPLLTDPQARRRNQEAILEALTLLPPERLGGFPAVAGDPLSGWLALGGILAAHDAPEAQSANLARWRQDYPGHPADGEVLQAYLNRRPPASASAAAPAPAVTGPTVAVLLPASGANAAYGESLRQGIVAAHAGDSDPAKPALRFYDSASGDVAALYRQAVEEGAEVVVGPLRKEYVAALAQAGDLPKPVLALNRIDATRDGLYQFSLAPEDELDQAADLAWREGRRNALVLVPAKDFGQRMASHFSDYWSHLGGRITAVQTYLAGEKDFAAPIKKLLRVDEPSNERPQTPRADAEVIFLVAEPHDARMLVSQLRYYGATRLPIYATASVYAGRPNRPQDQDLAGVVFCDAPWLLAGGDSGQHQAGGANPRLWAMGMDAYPLSRRLATLQGGGAHYDGASGTLTLEPGNRIHRQLQCARFDGGVPVPLGAAAPAAPPQPSSQ